MNIYSTKSLTKMLAKRWLAFFLNFVPEGPVKFRMRSFSARRLGGIPVEFLAKSGETVVLVGFHRVDSVMHWSSQVGKDGRVILIEAVPEYIDNIRSNLENHLNWPVSNITYISKGVDSQKGRKKIQIGQRADYNKLADQAIDDGLTASSYVRELEIETDSMDHILDEIDPVEVNHIHMTISGMEVEALKGMTETLKIRGLRLQIRSLHVKDGELLYPKVVQILQDSGMKVAAGRETEEFRGRDIYASRL